MINISDFFKKIKGLRVAVIGDVILDEYIVGEVDRISPEAPVPVVRTEKIFHKLGGAANVALNIKRLGAEPLLMGIVGEDREGEKIIGELEREGIETRYLLIEKGWKTIVKSRIVARNQQMLRIDYENNGKVKGKFFQKFQENLRELKRECKSFLIQDYEKGLFFKKTIERVLELKNKLLFVDPKFENFFLYKNVFLFKPNIREVEMVTGKKIKNKKDEIKIIKGIKNKIGCKNIVVTRGERGMLGIDFKNRIFEIPSINVEVYDVTGAGDTVISLLTLGISSGFDIIDSSIIATIGAGIEVTRMGVYPVTKSELTEGFKRFYNILLKEIKIYKE